MATVEYSDPTINGVAVRLNISAQPYCTIGSVWCGASLRSRRMHHRLTVPVAKAGGANIKTNWGIRNRTRKRAHLMDKNQEN